MKEEKAKKIEKAKKTEKTEKVWERVTQEFAPVCDANCRVLILGTAPSRKSREVGFYYGHPQNRFWKMLAAVTGEEVPQSIEEKKALLLRNHIALHDVIHSCDIIGSSDSSIRNVEPADLERILAVTGRVALLESGTPDRSMGRGTPAFYKRGKSRKRIAVSKIFLDRLRLLWFSYIIINANTKEKEERKRELLHISL